LDYWQRSSFSAIESGEREVGSVVELLGGADNICVSTDFPHFDSRLPAVSTRVLHNPSITPEIAGKILFGGARLYGFTEIDFEKADSAAKRRDNRHAARALNLTRRAVASGRARFGSGSRLPRTATAQPRAGRAAIHTIDARAERGILLLVLAWSGVRMCAGLWSASTMKTFKSTDEILPHGWLR
jgi:hypothetical protein